MRKNRNIKINNKEKNKKRTNLLFSSLTLFLFKISSLKKQTFIFTNFFPIFLSILFWIFCYSTYTISLPYTVTICHMQVYPSRNYIPTVISSSNYTNTSSMMAIFLIICLMAVLQLFGYSVFHSRDTSIQLSLL